MATKATIVKVARWIAQVLVEIPQLLDNNIEFSNHVCVLVRVVNSVGYRAIRLLRISRTAIISALG